MWISVPTFIFAKVTHMLEAIIALAIALIAWGGRLESKTNVNDQRQQDFLTLLDAKLGEKIAPLSQKLDGIDRRLGRVEDRMDSTYYRENE